MPHPSRIVLRYPSTATLRLFPRSSSASVGKTSFPLVLSAFCPSFASLQVDERERIMGLLSNSQHGYFPSEKHKYLHQSSFLFNPTAPNSDHHRDFDIVQKLDKGDTRTTCFGQTSSAIKRPLNLRGRGLGEHHAPIMKC